MTGVLLGGRSLPHSRTPATFIVRLWLPVVIMLLVIARESTEGFGSVHTSALLRPVYQAVFGAVSDARWEHVHHILRKSGHFVGYGTLGLTWLRAWLYTWLTPLRHASVGTWRALAWQMAMACTAVVAALDELHQTWIPDRTGLMTDVLLDTCGAIVLCGTVAVLWQMRARHSSRGSSQRPDRLAADS